MSNPKCIFLGMDEVYKNEIHIFHWFFQTFFSSHFIKILDVDGGSKSYHIVILFPVIKKKVLIDFAREPMRFN